MAASVIVDSSTHGFNVTDNAAFYGNIFTASIWYKINTDPNNYGYLFGNANGTSFGWNLIWSQNSGATDRMIQGRLNTGTQYNALDTTARAINIWHFAAMTFSNVANELKIFYGNESTQPIQVGSTITTSGNMGITGGDLTFGANPNDTTYRDIKVSDARIYNATIRSQAQLQSDYKQRLVGTETGLTDYWKFNEGSGNTATNSTSARNATATTGSWSADEPAFTTTGVTANASFLLNFL